MRCYVQRRSTIQLVARVDARASMKQNLDVARRAAPRGHMESRLARFVTCAQIRSGTEELDDVRWCIVAACRVEGCRAAVVP